MPGTFPGIQYPVNVSFLFSFPKYFSGMSLNCNSDLSFYISPANSSSILSTIQFLNYSPLKHCFPDILPIWSGTSQPRTINRVHKTYLGIMVKEVWSCTILETLIITSNTTLSQDTHTLSHCHYNPTNHKVTHQWLVTPDLFTFPPSLSIKESIQLF